jgi:DNA-binding NarL/FixJ family response regulator
MTPINAQHITKSGILVVDDHELVRLGFRALVQSQHPSSSHPLLTVYEACSLTEALALYEQHQSSIAVVVLDLSLPDTEGLDSLVTFRQQFPKACIVVLSGTTQTTTQKNVMALGAVAFFPKAGDLGDMLSFVQNCALHGPQIAKQQQAYRASGFDSDNSPIKTNDFTAAPGQTLSTRQLQILQWVLEGKSNREISECAFLSEGTVKNHVSTLLLSFGVRSRAQLISKLRL